MTHTMPVWLRRVFLQILPRLLWMESPKLRAKRFEYELLSTDNIEQTIILENPHHKWDETTSDRRQRRRSKYMNQVIFKKKFHK
jgi:hypothetical protein